VSHPQKLPHSGIFLLRYAARCLRHRSSAPATVQKYILHHQQAASIPLKTQVFGNFSFRPRAESRTHRARNCTAGNGCLSCGTSPLPLAPVLCAVSGNATTASQFCWSHGVTSRTNARGSVWPVVPDPQPSPGLVARAGRARLPATGDTVSRSPRLALWLTDRCWYAHPPVSLSAAAVSQPAFACDLAITMVRDGASYSACILVESQEQLCELRDLVAMLLFPRLLVVRECRPAIALNVNWSRCDRLRYPLPPRHRSQCELVMD